ATSRPAAKKSRQICLGTAPSASRGQSMVRREVPWRRLGETGRSTPARRMNRSKKRMAKYQWNGERSYEYARAHAAARAGATRARARTAATAQLRFRRFFAGTGGRGPATGYRTLHWQDAAEGDSAEILSGSDVDARSTTGAGIGIHRTTPNDVNMMILRGFPASAKGFPHSCAHLRNMAPAVSARNASPGTARTGRRTRPRWTARARSCRRAGSAATAARSTAV